jgi:hypothetical protein
MVMGSDEIAKQKQQYAAILNSVRASGLKEDQILELVKQIAQGMQQISEATKRRSITSQQRELLLGKLKAVADTNLLIDVQAGDDNRLFTEDFLNLFIKDLSWKSVRKRFAVEEVPTTRVYFIISKEDNDAYAVPDGCVLTGESLRDLHLVDDVLSLSAGEPVAPPRGTCTLYISRRKLPPQ